MAESDNKNPYRKALFSAFSEMVALREQEKVLTVKKAQLKKTVDALFPLAFPEHAGILDVAKMTLADAIRLVVGSSGGRCVSIKEIRGKLQDLGFDLTKYENPLASIHTATRRMVESEELVWADDDGKKLQAGPEMKSLTDSAPTEEHLNALLGDPREVKDR